MERPDATSPDTGTARLGVLCDVGEAKDDEEVTNTPNS